MDLAVFLGFYLLAVVVGVAMLWVLLEQRGVNPEAGIRRVMLPLLAGSLVVAGLAYALYAGGL